MSAEVRYLDGDQEDLVLHLEEALRMAKSGEMAGFFGIYELKDEGAGWITIECGEYGYGFLGVLDSLKSKMALRLDDE